MNASREARPSQPRVSEAPHVIGALLEGLPEPAWLVDGESFTVSAINRAALRLLGLKPERALGQQPALFCGSLEDEAFWQGASRDPFARIRSDTVLTHSDGQPRWVSRAISPIHTPDGGRYWLVLLHDQTRRRRAEAERETLLAELRATLESTADGILVCSLDGAMRAFNRRFAQMWEIPKSMLLQRDDAALHALLASQVEDGADYQQRLAEINASVASEATDMLLLRSGRLLQRTVLPQFSRGRIIGRVFSFHDITERAAADKGLRLAAKVFESCPDAVFITDAHHKIVSVNPACCKLTRHDREVLVGLSAIDLFEERDAGRLFTEVQKSWQASGFWEGEVWHRRGDGSNCPVRLSWVVLRGPAGEVVQTIGFFRDLSGQRAAQQRIEDLAYSDVLTGLPNRLLLSRRVDRVLQLRGDAAAPFAILFVDLDRFKNINDSLGHQFGDRVLVKVADRIKSCLRLADTLARLGGDEFVIHLHNADAPSAEVVAQRIIEALAQPFTLDDMRFSVSCSIGVALHPQDGLTLDDLVRHADT
ncbi:MAG: diguanylate cyclase, partial [Comamonadaceae bacterium]